MKKMYLTSIFCSFAIINTAAAAENNVAAAADLCARFNETPRLNMMTSYGKLRYNYDYDRNSLTKMGRSYGLIEPNMQASGLSLLGVDWSVTLNTSLRVAQDGSVCVIPSSLDVFVGFQEPTIYIDKSLVKDSCRYNLVMRHEHQHQQIGIAALEYFVPRMRRQIIEILPTVKTQNIASLSQANDATAAMNEQYIKLIAPMVENFKATMLNAQKKLDNTANYKYESTICRGH